MSCADSDEQRKQNTERYRSGHNEAVLKTVCPQGHMGSNPILSARRLSRLKKNSKEFFFCVNIITSRERENDLSSYMEKYPSWPKGHPWKGCRSLTAARGFKSLLLRFESNKKIQKVVDKKRQT